MVTPLVFEAVGPPPLPLAELMAGLVGAHTSTLGQASLTVSCCLLWQLAESAVGGGGWSDDLHCPGHFTPWVASCDQQSCNLNRIRSVDVNSQYL